ncbi:hypothetical protein CDL12_11636 [Handroanthus impetiginosus]|uniref:Uncharacterized protein n=1 Tax=Handroanthus impetiginosus TaxID=429701 RepID=A0A2G9HEN6_9LAMI|nr:hypothetical protein CDL12_11636 [Handroanthus impetiginosus]
MSTESIDADHHDEERDSVEVLWMIMQISIFKTSHQELSKANGGTTTTPGKLNQSVKSGKGDATIEGSTGGYGGSGVSSTGNNSTAQEGGHGGFGTLVAKDRRRREDVDMEDAATGVAESVAETAKAGVVGATEAGLKFGEMAKETMDRMWDAAKETTENVRDRVAGIGDDDDNDPRNEGTDKHVEDLRRMERGYDLKDD